MPQLRFRRYLLVLIIAVLTLAAAVLSNFDRILIFTASKLYSIDISYKNLAKDKTGGYNFENLKIASRKMGLGFYCQRAVIKPVSQAQFWKSLIYDFKFKDLHFIKIKGEERKAKYDTLDGLVAMPFEGKWTYKEISGVVEIFSNGITLKKFNANGSKIRLILSGDLFYNNVLDTNITIFFAKDVLKDIPPELYTVIMKEEPEEWRSFSVKIKGNLASPSIQVEGELFRLNVGTVVMH